MTVIRGQFDQLLQPGARKVFVDDYNELPAIYPSLFNVDTSGKAFEDDLVITGLPIALKRPEGAPIAMDRPKFRGRVRYIHAGFGLGYEITREAVEDDVYGALNSQGASNLARSMRETEEVTAHAVLNGAFTTVLTYDGVSLINTAHLGVGGLTFSNRANPDADLSTTTLKASLERFMDLRTDRDLKINLMPSKVLVSVFGWWNALEILQTQFVTTLAGPIISNEVTNVLSKQGLMPVKSQYLTDADAWYALVDKSARSYPLQYYWRSSPQDVSGFEAREQISWFGIIARMSSGATNWRGIDGSTGA
jgi:phage major head subunit gpT-like protein